MSDAATLRYHKRRETILDAASDQINSHGLKGLRLVSVAEAVGLNTTSITHYFKRRDLLAAATLERAIRRLDDMAAEAATEPDPRARVARLFALHFALVARIRRAEAHPETRLSDLRALDDPARGALIVRYRAVLDRVAGFFGASVDPDQQARNTARAQVLMDILHWSRIWTPHYSVSDFTRVQAQLMALMDYGLAPAGVAWAPQVLPLDTGPDDTGEIGREAYLRAGTHLLNERGYRGASVEGIAARLNVSKGSFYHHLAGKDELVLACFTRSYQRTTRAQTMAMESPGTWWDRIASCMATLLHIQFDARFPLLRTIAMQALPPERRPDVLQLSERMAQRFAGMMFDGMAEGSVRHVDPFIASQCLLAVLNGAIDQHQWAAARPTRQDAVAIYAAPFVHGIFDPD
ncbi:TetR/AcrR family transcriptional regulator [Pseudosulfitobacter koreensis]|uniref:TetR/AcrR family transcriptional regulator n=1 Tax=Pseudosulfitobacter koreensis TaxID=2968472 RepID=A0ABT1Z1F8_9RHOB|nr:TetR/AcrR family transcriptional regulator [Pseudosulfitobacter koreense]MCR8826982.1 TetR/AcrR family transcriptional regulator [Pseudosulfitobacter koreense]